MREIKFRGKRIDNGKLIYGNLVTDCVNANSKIILVGIQAERCYPVEVILGTVGQFTGLKDNREINIYESDLVSDGERLFRVEWNQQNAGFWLIYVKYLTAEEDYFIHSINSSPLGNGYLKRRDLEVVGNIHANPELL